MDDTFNYGVEQAKLQRKQQLLQALMLQRMREKPSAVVGNSRVFVPNYGAAIRGAYDRYRESQLGNEVDAETKDFAKKANEQLAGGLSAYESKRMGQPYVAGQDTRALDESGAEGPPPTAIGRRSPDALGAIVEAMRSGHPDLKQLALEDLKGLRKSLNIDPLEIFKLTDYDPESKLAAAQGQGIGALKPKVGYKEVNGQMVPENKPGDYRTTYKPPEPGGAGLPPRQEANVTGEVKGLTGGNVTPTDSSTFSNKVAGNVFEDIQKGRTAALSAVEGLKPLLQAKSTMEQIPPEAFGATANIRMVTNKILESIGATPIPETRGIETLNQDLGYALLERIRAFAPVTNQDIAEMRRIIGSTTNTKDALQKAVDFSINILNSRVEAHNNFVKQQMNVEGTQPETRARLEPYMVNFRYEANPVPGLGGPPAAGPAGSNAPPDRKQYKDPETGITINY